MEREEAIQVVRGLTETTYFDDRELEGLRTLIPELTESEDERIRKMCITAVNIAASADGGLLHHEAKQCLDWLEEQKDKNCLACDQHLKGYLAGRKVTEEEKQKENPKSADSIPSDCVSDVKCEDRSPKHTDSFGTDIRDTPAYWRGWDDAMKQKEQKPVDYDHEMWKNCEANFEGGKNEVIEHPEKYGLQKPAEWSEEDLEHIKSIIHRTEVYGGNCLYGRAKEDVEWLKNLLNRFLIQPKQEWSEEDEELLDAMIDMVSNSLYEPLCPREGMLAWLKSLRPQPHWKPSEEQMEAFKGYIEEFQARAEAAVGGWNNFDVMIRLYEQLKKL